MRIYTFRFAGIGFATLAAFAVPAQTFQGPYAGVYTFSNLGLVPAVLSPLGGIVFKAGHPNKMLVGGAANSAAGVIYEVDVVRNGQGFITGFAGPGTQFASAPNIDGGLCYGPGGVLFYTTFNNNTLGQIKPGSTAPDKIINLTPLGVGASTGTCNFVPTGFPGAGQLKIASYTTGMFHGFTVSPDGNGTYDLAPANGPAQISGGPEGILYVPPGSALIPNYQNVLVTEYGFANVVLYQLDGNGNPLPATRVLFMTGLTGAEGACTDPITGDLMFSTFGGSNIIRVTGFGVCGSFINYGTGIPGQNGVPAITGGGCAGRGQVTTIDIGSGRPGAAGLLAVGFTQTSIPVFNGSLLVNVVNSYFHILDGTGHWNLTILLPTDPVWNGLTIYSQSFYVDPAATFGIAATNGLRTLVR